MNATVDPPRSLPAPSEWPAAAPLLLGVAVGAAFWLGFFACFAHLTIATGGAR